jgi:hypothetical protein
MITTTQKAELLDVLTDCYESTKTMAEVFFPHYCYRPFGVAHDPIFEILDNDEIKLGLIVCPRGWGKTTLTGLVFPAKKILFKDLHYIVYISSTASKAIKDVQTLANELTTNEQIKKLFGNVKGVRWAEGEGQLIINIQGHEICIEAKGAGHQIRGIKFREFRPELILIDDLEDPEQVRNEERRKTLKNWLFADVLNSVDLEKTRIVMMGTVLHEDSLIQNILDEEKWKENLDELTSSDAEINALLMAEKFTSVRIEACDDKLEATWPSFMSTAKIKAKAEAYTRRGLLDVFFREMRNLVIPSQGAAFDSSMFKRYSEDFSYRQGVESIVIVDPAKTLNFNSADSAIVGVGFDHDKSRVLVQDCRNGKLQPDVIYKEACDMADRLHTLNIAIEVTSLNMFITYPFRAYIATRQKPYQLIELTAKGDKLMRIRALVPFYRMGRYWHNENLAVRGPVETQLMVFPNGKLVDVIDALAYSISAFDLGNRLFSADTKDLTEDERLKMEEDEFSILEKDDYDTAFISSCVV